MVIGLVGDLDPAQVFPIVEKYFGQLSTTPKPEEPFTDEPPQNSVREVTLHDPVAALLSGGLPSAKLSRPG